MRQLGSKHNLPGVKIKLVVASVLMGTLMVGCKSNSADITATSSAQEVYQASCAGCHEGGFKGWMTDAPVTGETESWKPRLAKGVDALTTLTIAGLGKMPAKGGCNTCTDEQIKSAVELMVERSK